MVTKTDIAEPVEWDRAAAYAALVAVNPTAPVIETSARTGAGVDVLLDLLLGATVPSIIPLQEAP